jgi:single-strand DNA-binding protein
MAGVNKVILLGNLGKDPEIRTLENGVKVCTFSLATSESYKDRNSGETITRTEWHNIVMWRGLADVAERFLKKGSQIYVEGKIQTRNYQDKEGNQRYMTEVVANEMTMLGGRPGGQNEGGGSQNRPEPAASGNNRNDSAPSGGDDEEDDLPF